MNRNQGVEDNAVKTTADACIVSCQKWVAQIERAKGKLLTELQGTLDVPEKLFRMALGEAEALAWQTGYPQLLFPTLATEKVRAAAEWYARQQVLRQKTLFM
ncbi:MAG: hypothetical protein WBS33_13515 [Verrucomicrobiia bacterium]